MKKTYDCLVIGGGICGACAALAAADRGLRVLVIEPSNVIGGQGTAGGVAGFCGDTQRVNKYFAALIKRLQDSGNIADYNPSADRRPYDLEHCAYYLQELLLETAVDILLHAQVVNSICSDGSISGVQISTRHGIIDIEAGMLIDASGHCLLASQAGFEIQHLGANAQLPMGLYFTLWDSGKTVHPVLPDGCPQWPDDESLPMTTLHMHDTGKVEVKMKVVGFDAADPFSLSQAEMHARQQMMGLLYHLQTKGYQGRKLDRHVLASVSRQIGIREEERIIGEYVLSEDDVCHACTFDDAIAVGTYHLDYHWPDRVERDGTGICTMVEPYQIPLRSLIPKGARNLLVPGRAASADQMAMSSFRVMATVAQMGCAAGLAAVHARRAGSDLTQIHVPALQDDIRSCGQSLNLSDYGSYLRNKIMDHEHIYEKASFPSCHASTLVQMDNGRFLVAWFGGTAEKNPDVGIWGAERSNGTWSQPRLLIKMNDQAHWNPVLYYAGDGVVHLYFKVGVSAQEWETWRISSADSGQSWSEPVCMPNIGSQIRGPVKNKAIQLSNGDLLAGSSVEIKSNGKHKWRGPFVDRSTDNGVSWDCGDIITIDKNLPEELGVIQPALWESDPGHVHMLLRSNGGMICRSDSSDYGHSWCPVYATDLPNNNSGLDVAKLHDGTLAMVYNPVTEDWGPRTPLSVALSSDNGKTWPGCLDLETEPGEYSYPAIIPTQRGMAITYTWKRERIAFWHGSVEQIPQRIPTAVETNS